MTPQQRADRPRVVLRASPRLSAEEREARLARAMGVVVGAILRAGRPGDQDERDAPGGDGARIS